MNILKQKTDQEIEITVELSTEELQPYLEDAARHISKDVKIEGFRPGHVPYDVLKGKVGEMAILQEAANVAIQKTADKALKEKLDAEDDVIGRPEVRLTKAAPGNPLEYKIVLSVAPKVELGPYKDLGIAAPKTDISEEEIERVIKNLQDMRATEKLVDREIKESDKAIAAIQMFLDNVPVEGGQTRDTTVMIGADYIIPGFDKELIGAKKGDIREFKLPYPQDHYQKNLAGKLVDFKVEIKDVYERALPELTDDFAKSLGADTVDDLRKKIRENLEAEARDRGEQKTVVAIFEKILEHTTVSHLPEQLVHTEVHNMIDELKHNVEQQGGAFGDYLNHIKKTEHDLHEDFEPDAHKRLKTSFAIAEIIRKESIVVTDEELQTAVAERLKAYDHDPKLKAQADSKELRNYIRYNMLNQKVVEKLKEWNITK